MTRYALAALLLFVLHLPGVFLFRGEFTDGVLQTVYFDPPLYVLGEGVPPARYVPPLYPALIAILSKAGMEPLEGGRLISLAAYCGTAFALAWFGRAAGRRFAASFSPEALGWSVMGIWAVSPVANRWAFHAMSDMTFCFFATVSLAFLIRSSMTDTVDPARNWLIGNAAALLAVWTRYQGYALLGASGLALILLLARASKNASGEGRTGLERFLTQRNAAGTLLLIAAWAQTISFQKQGRAVHASQFAERAVYDFDLYLNFAIAGLRYLPDALGHPLFLLFLFGVWTALRRGGTAAFWAAAGLLGGAAGLIVQTRFLSFQFRYGLPLLPWVCLLGGIGLASLPRRYTLTVAGLTLLYLSLYTGAILYYQNGTFADLEAAARRIPNEAAEGAKVWAREEYNFLPDGSVRYANIKTSVWSGLPVKWLDEASVEDLAEGDLIVDSNIAPIPPEFWRRIRAAWKTEVPIEETDESLPLTPGEVVWIRHETPQGTRLLRATSDPELMKHRFKKQYYATQVHRLAGPLRTESSNAPPPNRSESSGE